MTRIDKNEIGAYTMSMTTDAKPFLGRCKHKDCDYAVFATQEDLQAAQTLDEVLPGQAYRMPRGVLARCPKSHRVFPLRQIEGTYSEAFKCDSRCLNAKGHICNCSCGGMNHGRGHAVQVQPLQTAKVEHPRRTAELRQQEREARAKFRGPSEGGTIEDRPARHPKQHIGEVGEKVYFTGELRDKREVNNSVLHVFYAEVRSAHIPFGCTVGEYLGEAKVEWWMPKYLADPGFELGETYDLKAKVKRHDDSPSWGKATVVIYLEEV